MKKKNVNGNNENALHLSQIALKTLLFARQFHSKQIRIIEIYIGTALYLCVCKVLRFAHAISIKYCEFSIFAWIDIVMINASNRFHCGLEIK